MSYRLELRPPSFDDVALLVRARCRQDAGWWGVEDTDDDEVRSLLNRAVDSTGSLDAGGRIVMCDGDVVGSSTTATRSRRAIRCPASPR